MAIQPVQRSVIPPPNRHSFPPPIRHSRHPSVIPAKAGIQPVTNQCRPAYPVSPCHQTTQNGTPPPKSPNPPIPQITVQKIPQPLMTPAPCIPEYQFPKLYPTSGSKPKYTAHRLTHRKFPNQEVTRGSGTKADAGILPPSFRRKPESGRGKGTVSAGTLGRNIANPKSLRP